VMRARHPAWFRQDLERLFGLLAIRAIRPRVAEAHRSLEAGSLEGRLVLCPDLPSQCDRDGIDRVAVAIRAVPV
jgi:NADPH:quinone reductase